MVQGDNIIVELSTKPSEEMTGYMRLVAEHPFLFGGDAAVGFWLRGHEDDIFIFRLRFGLQKTR